MLYHLGIFIYSIKIAAVIAAASAAAVAVAVVVVVVVEHNLDHTRWKVFRYDLRFCEWTYNEPASCL